MQESNVLEPSLLLQFFRSFAGVLLPLRDSMERAAKMSSVMPVPPAAATTPAPVAQAPAAAPAIAPDSSGNTADAGRQHLLALLEQQKAQAIALSASYGLEKLREAQYVMVALADELMLNATCPGSQTWRLLEQEVFHSHNSGEFFFTRLDALLRHGEAGSLDLAIIFFEALALDFRGQYRFKDPQDEVLRRKRQLFTRIFQMAPERLPAAAMLPGGTELSTEPAKGTAGLVLLPNPHRWWFALAGVALAWIVLSAIVWQLLTGSMDQQLQRIESQVALHDGQGTR